MIKELFILICILDDKDNAGPETETLYFDGYQSAYNKMLEQLDETGNRDDYSEGDDYEIEVYTAWSNMNSHCPCSWRIEKIPRSKTVTYEVVEHDGYEWAVLHYYHDGDVLGQKIPFADSPETEPRTWEQLRFKPILKLNKEE